jgi:hypothetical protein
MSRVKSNQEGAKIPRKKLTMENLKYSKKQCFLEGKDGIHHGGKKENQGRIYKEVPKGTEGRKD